MTLATSSNSTKQSWEFWRNPSNYHSGLPLLKRGLERWVNDFNFRKNFEDNPQKSLKDRGLNIDPFALQILSDPELAKQYSSGHSDTPVLVEQYRNFINSKRSHCIEIRDSHPMHLRWNQWRKRMIGSTLWRDGPKKHSKLVHAPFSIELTQGCTVGCWFCGVDAEKFQKPVELSPYTEAVWRKLLETFRSVCGIESAQHGFCYWATDPFDHPEYEWFLEEFHSILGYWPQTTTAQVMKHAPRMRALLEHTKNRNAFVQRCSMIRSGDFDAIHEYFSPEELFLCELIPQYDDRLSPKATSGRVRDLVIQRNSSQKPIQIHHNLEVTGSIACVSGFLINLVQQSLKIITPCNASERWPLGYRVLGESNFSSVDEIDPLIRKMLNTCLNNTLRAEDALTPYRGIVFSSKDDSTLIATKNGYSLSLPGVSYAGEFAEYLQNGSLTVSEICAKRSQRGVDSLYTSITLNQLFDQGIFDEDHIDTAKKSTIIVN